MQHINFFRYNIPADNQLNAHADKYLNVIAQWDESCYTDGRPIVHADIVNMTMVDAINVKNWLQAYREINTLAEKHFADLARQERINKAKAVLINEEMPAA